MRHKLGRLLEPVCTRKLVFARGTRGRTILPVSTYATQRAKERIAELAGRGHDLVAFWREATEAIGPAVRLYLTPCVYTLDPASPLATSHYHDVPGSDHDASRPDVSAQLSRTNRADGSAITTKERA